MSARLPSRWPSAAALLAAGVLSSAAVAQSPEPRTDPPARPVPQTAPAPAPIRPVRFTFEPLLIEQEQVSEYGKGPRAEPPAMPAPPRVYRGCNMPEYDRDDGRMAPEEMAFRCLLFTINPLAAFLPLSVEEVQVQTLPAPTYVNHPPQYIPPSPTFPVMAPVPEPVGMPREVERLKVMPKQVEQLDVMPRAEESEPHYQLLAPWTDAARLFQLPMLPHTEIKVSVQTAQTGSPLFGISAEVSRTGTITVIGEPLSDARPAPMAKVEETHRTGPADVPQVLVSMLVAEVTGKGARKLNLDRPADGKSARWVIEVADEARQKALKAAMLALREKGQAKPIAEPNLCTLSGQNASFLTGGEQAVLVTTWLGQAGVQFEEFGTRVTCRPTVLPSGTIRLDVEPEISELCEVAGGCDHGVIVPGRSTQRVHTTADIPAGGTLVISGPKAGGDTRLVLFVTPSVVEPPPAVPQPVFDFDSAERVHGVINGDDDEDSVHELLVKCRRELSRGHYAAAEDLAQRAIERDRKAVAADPLVRESGLLQRVKAIAALPLGTVDPCAAKDGGRGIVPAGAAKAIGSDERVVEALLEEFNTAYKEARYSDAEALAQRARDMNPENAMAAAALQLARLHMPDMRLHAGTPAPVSVVSFYPNLDNTIAEGASAAALARFRSNFKEGRYEEAKVEALRALTVAPGSAMAVAALQQACEALSRQPRPLTVPQCTYVGTSLRPSLPAVDPAVVGALQKILLERDKAGPFGGSEEAEPKDDGSKPRR
jgi:tetratricopeptide (TPR) repeat protein